MQAEQPTEDSAAEEIARLRRDLNEARQHAALGELVSTTTHEFNNVLTTILNYAKLGLRHTDEASRTRALEKILSAGQRAAKITNSVLGMAHRRGAETAPTDLAALVAESLVLLERELSKYRVMVETSFQTERRAMVAPTQIQQVLLNLLTNSRQAMPNGGRVQIFVAEGADAKQLELTVRDTGAGIPAEVLPRIFERDFSTKSGPDETGKGGAGLGLAACKEIIESHGGSIHAESTPGQGTTFILKLPVAIEPQSKAPIMPLGVPTANPSASPNVTR